MTTNEKCILITIFIAIIAAIVIVLSNADTIDGNAKLREVVVNAARC